MFQILVGEPVEVTFAKPIRTDLYDDNDLLERSVRILSVTGRLIDADEHALMIECVSVRPHVDDFPHSSWMHMDHLFVVARTNVLGAVSADGLDVPDLLARKRPSTGYAVAYHTRPAKRSAKRPRGG